MNKRIKVLYVEMAHGMGGSLVSLHQLLRGLDRERYEPIVLFYWDIPYIQRFRELGVETIVWSGPRQEGDSPVPVPLPTAVNHLRQQGSRLRRLEAQRSLRKLYHAAGFYARTLFQTLPLALRIRRLVRSRGVDIVHANDLVMCNREVIMAARMSARPCICHIRAFESYTPLDRFLAQFVDRFIFISQCIAQDSIRQGAEPTKGTVIYNALDLAEFLQSYDDGAERARLGLAPDDRVVGILGRLVPWKGHRVFLEAMARVARQVPNLRCLIVGDAAPGEQAYRAELEALARDLGLGERCKFLGWRSDVPALLSVMDVLVHASLDPEPFGRVLIEGMAAAKPVVAADGGACPEIIEHGVSGLLVPPGEAQALADAVAGLLGDPDRLHTMGIMARHQAEARFSIDEHVRQVERVYEELLGRGGVAP